MVVAVCPDTTCLNAPPHTVGAIHVTRPKTRAQAKLCVIGDRQGFGLIFKCGYRYYRAKNFFLKDTHLIAAFHYRRLNIIAFGKATAYRRNLATH